MQVSETKPSGKRRLPELKNFVLPALSVQKSDKKAATIHGGREYWRAFRQASELASSQGKYGGSYLRAMHMNDEEREEQRKAARLSLDTSAHGGSKYREMLEELEADSKQSVQNTSNRTVRIQRPLTSPIKSESSMGTTSLVEKGDKGSLEVGGRGRNLALQALESTKTQNIERSRSVESPSTLQAQDIISYDENNISKDVIDPQELESIMGKLRFRKGRSLTQESLTEGLQYLGYKVEPSEVALLMEQLDLNSSNKIEPSEFVASQIDWPALQQTNKELWLECAKRAFQDLDKEAQGRINAEALVSSLRSKLPDDEIDFAMEDALAEAGIADPEALDFEGFLRMVQIGSSYDSLDSLEQYESRQHMHSPINSPGGTVHKLDTVPEL